MKRFLYRDSIRSARLAMPPAAGLAIVGAAYLMLEMLVQMALSGNGWPILGADPSFLQFLQSLMICIAAVFFAGYRVVRFHPCLHRPYRDWLKLTAWRPGKALPVGPVTLTFADALLLLAAMALVWHAGFVIPPFGAPAIFAAVYLSGVAYVLIRLGPRSYAYAVLFGLGGMATFADRPQLALLVAAPTYVVAWYGLRRSLERLPDFEPGWLEKSLTSATLPPLARTEFDPLLAGWPFGYLCPRRPLIQLPLFDAVSISLVAGWLLYCAMSLFGLGNGNRLNAADHAANGAFVAVMLGSVVPVGRLILYGRVCRPPVSVLGRLATGRLLIPSYDQALIAPLVSLAILWWLGPRVMAGLEVPLAVREPITLTLALLAALIPGPAFRNWSLTSECRLVPSRMPQNNWADPSGRR